MIQKNTGGNDWHIILEDMLYGLGICLDDEFKMADGYAKFKQYLKDGVSWKLKKDADKNHTQIAVPETSDGLQSACILCHISNLENLSTFFNGGGRKIEDWIRQLPFSAVPFENQACFLNINTEEELKKSSL